MLRHRRSPEILPMLAEEGEGLDYDIDGNGRKGGFLSPSRRNSQTTKSAKMDDSV